MTRTYWAEGRNIAKLFTGIFVLISLYLSLILGKNGIPLFFVFLLISVILGNIIGALWTRYRRKQSKKSKLKVITTTKDYSKQSNRKILSDEDLIWSNIDTLSGPDFERLIALYYRDKGYMVQMIGGAGDHEVDLILTDKKGMKIAVQCKRWKQDVGNDIILRLKAGKQVHGCYDAWVITTANFTPAAKQAAEKLRIRLINGLMVHDMMRTWRTKLKANGRRL